MSFLSRCCVGFASPGCADPKGTVLGANTFARDKGGAAVGMSAGYLLAVLPTMAAPLPSVGYAPLFNTLAVCSVFAAQASRLRFGGAAFHRARLPEVCTASRCSYRAWTSGAGFIHTYRHTRGENGGKVIPVARCAHHGCYGRDACAV